MAESKIESFSDDDVEIAKLAKALAHPARIRVLKILMETNACMCGDIVELMPLAQSTVSQHLKELKNAGLIKGIIEGPKTCYCLDNDRLIQMKAVFEKLINKICSC